MNIYDRISADQIEVGDQIVIDDDPIEVKSVSDDESDIDGIVIEGYSHTTGDTEKYILYFSDSYDLWSA